MRRPHSPRRSRLALTSLALTAALAVAAVAPAYAADDEGSIADMFAPRSAEARPGEARSSEPRSSAAAAATGVQRLAGADRFETAVKISKANFAPGVNVVLIANGMTFPDALSGAPVAGATGAPILLVTAGAIPASVKAELKRLAPSFIAVLGGTGAVGSKVYSQLKGYATSGEILRLAGADRYQTSGVIAKEVFGDMSSTVYIANGTTFPDALAAGPAAGLNGAPLLLVQSNKIPDPIKARLAAIDPSDIVVMGGTGAVSDSVVTQLRKYTPNVHRIAGADRYGTAAMMSSIFWQDVPTPTVYISSGLQFPDALAVAPVAAGEDGPLLLVQPNAIPQSVKDELRVRKPQRIVIVGGTGAVNTAVAKALEKYIVP